MQQPVETTSATCATSPDAARGFTLIEVLIVTAIIGILAAVGYPSYTQYVNDTRRSDGHLALMAASQSMERCKSTRFSYANCVLSDDDQTSPEEYYSLAVDTTASTFTLTATAQGAQASDTDCKKITLDHLSVKGPKSGTDPSICWKQ